MIARDKRRELIVENVLVDLCVFKGSFQGHAMNLGGINTDFFIVVKVEEHGDEVE